MRQQCEMGKWLFLAATAILINPQMGSAESQKRGVVDRPAIRSIYVDAAVALPKEPRLVTRGQGLGVALGGVVGGAAGGAAIGGISESGGGTPEQQFLAHLNSNKIRIGEMLPTAFIDEINKYGLFQIVASPDSADAVINLEVQVYGLGYTANPFSHDYRAFLHARGTLTRVGGKVVWSKRIWESGLDDQRPSASMQDLFNQPELMRSQMTAAISEVAREFVADLRKTKP